MQVSFYAIQVMALLAGLTLFLTGMSAMSKGLQEAAGKGLRRILQRATAKRLPALGLGTMLGGLIHSSAASVMLIGFISAGLVTFASSIPVILGINIGTTLSMLMISFRLGDACWLAITIGFALRMLWPKAQPTGTALLGFGLIFLGLNTMSEAIYPFRETLAPILRFADGNTVRGMLTGVLVSTLFTAIIQSSGATIGMVFAMLTAGAMTSFEQAYPIIIGANVGTCATALIGAARSTTEAKRCALTHLLFNVFATSLAMITAPLMFRLIPLTTALAAPPDAPAPPHLLVSQCANANVIKMAVAAFLVVPFTPVVAAAVGWILPNRKTDDLASLLDSDLTETPEDALQAAMLELHRMVELCRERLAQQSALLLIPNKGAKLQMQATEQAVIAIQESMHRFLRQLTELKLTRRQSLLVTLLYNGIDHCERMAEHIGVLASVLADRHRARHCKLPKEVFERLLDMNRRAVETLQALEDVLTPLTEDRSEAIDRALRARDAFMGVVATERDRIAADLAAATCTPPAAVFRSRFFTEMSRIVKHARALAQHAQDPHFRIQPKRLGKSAKPLPSRILSEAGKKAPEG